MNPSTGNMVLDGVVQLGVAALAKSPMTPDALPDFLKKLSETLVQCVKDGDAAAAGRSLTAVRKELEAPSAPAAPEVKASAPEAPKAETPAPAAPKQAAARQPRAVQAKAAAAPAATETVAAAPAATAPAEEAPAAKAKKAAKPEYKFASISRTPVVAVADSVQDDGIVCLIDGQKRKMLHRYLKSKYFMTEEEYRTHFNLPSDYPMTAPGYSREKSHMAHKQGLGTPRLYEKKGATPAKVTKRDRKPAKQPASASA